MKSIYKIVFLLALAAVVGWALVNLSFPSISNLFKPAAVTIDKTPAIITQIKSIAQLITISAYDEIVADSTAQVAATLSVPFLKPIDIPGIENENKLVIIGRVTSHIGIDMQGLQKENISITKDSIHITLPAASVLDVILNPSDVEVFIEKGTWDNTAVSNLKNKIRYLAMANVKSRGLLMQAETKAREVITGFFKSAGYKQISVAFK